MISVASDYVEEFWAIGPPVSLCSLELSAPLILFVGLLQTLFTLQVSALNIEGIDSSIVLLVAGSGLAEPGVDIPGAAADVQAWPSWISVGANHFRERGKREDPTCWIRFVPRATNYA
ncbi:hypothetical protein FocTR4_00005342 [Fusarium oxysporum f. sp. cubense]|uniref:Uncharacterized protein n=1 Tax=Fusarium oxysporum f. sp. cubense TaxID=61366 RepID=A0A5C6TH07_FUSOC|nr:hypothetical protein FocTR4_00005342 [Fusarium oxysporum f. sp. cubense]